MIEKIGVAAMLEQLAEEATELAHAALKLARIERGIGTRIKIRSFQSLRCSSRRQDGTTGR